MSDRDEELSAEEQRVRAVLRGAPADPPDPAFRARMKRDFVSGAIEVTGAKKKPRRKKGRAVLAVEDEADVIRRLVARRRRPPTYAWIAGSVAVAAALVIVFVTLNRGPSWGVTAARGEGALRVDGETVALNDRDAMRRLVVPGAELEVNGNAEVDLYCGGIASLQLTPGTRMTLPPPPGRWMGRDTEVYVRAGELRVTTGPELKDARLAIMSPGATTEVRGTTFAVIIEEAGTCVCVYEGTAVVGRRPEGAGSVPATDMQPVPAGMRRYVFRDGRPPEMAGMREEERARLAQFAESQRPWLQGDTPQK